MYLFPLDLVLFKVNQLNNLNIPQDKISATVLLQKCQKVDEENDSLTRLLKRGRRRTIWKQVVKKKIVTNEICKKIIGQTKNFGNPDAERRVILGHMLKVI